jgi:hypothetical protein
VPEELVVDSRTLDTALAAPTTTVTKTNKVFDVRAIRTNQNTFKTNHSEPKKVAVKGSTREQGPRSLTPRSRLLGISPSLPS